MSTYIVMVGEDPETATPVHNIDGTLGRFSSHAEAAAGAKEMVASGLTTKGAFVARLAVTAFYLPIPVPRREALHPAADLRYAKPVE